MDSVKHLQNEVKMSGLSANPDKDGFACSTFNTQNPDGGYILGRNFDCKAAPCLVCRTAPENGYKAENRKTPSRFRAEALNLK